MVKRRMVDIRKLFGDDELRSALQIIRDIPSGKGRTDRLVEVVRPALPSINEKTGQDNDARYLAYALEYALSKSH